MRKCPEDQAADLYNYMFQILMRPSGTEITIFRLFGVGIWAKKPLQERLNDLSIPVSFIYGEKDWMDGEAGQIVADSHTAESRVWIVHDSDHHLYIDNPAEFSEKIIEEMSEVLGKGKPTFEEQPEQKRHLSNN